MSGRSCTNQSTDLRRQGVRPAFARTLTLDGRETVFSPVLEAAWHNESAVGSAKQLPALRTATMSKDPLAPDNWPICDGLSLDLAFPTAARCKYRKSLQPTSSESSLPPKPPIQIHHPLLQRKIHHKFSSKNKGRVA